MQTDADATEPSHPRAVSPPLPAQPQTFDSLLSRIGPPASTMTKVTTESPVAVQLPMPEGQPQTMATETSTVPATLPFSFGAPVLPKPASKPADVVTSPFASSTATSVPSTPATSTPASGVPSFFSNTRTQFTPPKVPLDSLFGGSPRETEKQAPVEPPPKNASGAFGEPNQEEKQDGKEKQKEAKPSPFGDVSKPSVLGGSSTPVFGSESSFGHNANGTPADTSSRTLGSAQTSVPGEAPGPTCLSNAQTATSAEPPKPGISVLGSSNKIDADSASSASDAPPKSAFSFDALPLSSTSSHSFTPVADGLSKSTFSFDAAPSTSTPSTESPKPLFPFGASASIQPKNSATDVPKTPFSFGAATSPPVDKKPAFAFNSTSGANTSGFSFSSGASPHDAVNGTSAEAPKPLFTGFGNATTTQKPPESTSPEGGDGMEMAGDRMEESPTRTVDKKDASISQLPQSTVFGSFGGGSGGNSNSSTGFTFGQAKPASSADAFAFGQSKPSTTPAFGGFGQNLDKLNPGANTNAGFSFGNGATKAVGQPQSSFAAPLNTSFGAPISGSTGSTSFSFGQAATNVNANPFGQQQQPERGTSAAPSSPSLFPQPTPQPQPQSSPFSFNASASSGAFPSSNLGSSTPSSTTTQPFQFGTSNATQQAGSTVGSNMFTLGGAATPPRRVKGLPNRRAKRP